MLQKKLIFPCLILFILLSGCTNGKAISSTCPNQNINSSQSQYSTPESKPLFRISQNGKIGFIDNTGRIVIKPQFDIIKDFSNNRAAFGSKNGKWGFIDINGQVIVPPKFENVSPFYEQRAAVKQNGKWGFIDINGQIKVQPQFNQVSRFFEGRAAVQKGYLWGFIDQAGKFIAQPKFSGYTNFSEGLAGFESYENSQNKTGFIDKNGKLAIELENVNIDVESFGFTNGLAPVWTRVPINGIFDETGRGKKMWGFIDRSGKVVIPTKYEYVLNFKDCLAAVQVNNKWGYINTLGQMVIQPQFDQPLFFSEGLASVKINQKYGYINQDGKEIISPQFYAANSFSEGLASVQMEKDGKWGFINSSGNIVIKTQFDWAGSFSSGLAQVKIGSKYGYIDRNGKYIWKLTN